MRKSRGFDPPLSAEEIAFYESSCWFPEHFMDTRGLCRVQKYLPRLFQTLLPVERSGKKKSHISPAQIGADEGGQSETAAREIIETPEWHRRSGT